MHTWARQFLAPPVFPEDEDKTHLAGILNTLVLASLVVTLLIPAIYFIFVPQQFGRLIFDLFTILLLLATRGLTYRGQLRLASLLMVGGFWLVITLTTITSGGVHAPEYSSYILLVLEAGLLLGWRAALSIAGISILTGLGLASAEVYGLLKPSSPASFAAPFQVWAIQSIFFVLAAVFWYIATDTIGKALTRAYHELAERKQAEQKLRESEERLRQEHDLVSRLMETSPMGILKVDRTGQISFANTCAEQILGLSREAITQLSYNAPAWQITDEAGQPFPEEQLPFRQVMATQRPVHGVRHAIEWPDRRRVFLSINAAPLFSEAGEIEGVVATVEDITKRKQTEEALRQREAILEAVTFAAEQFLKTADWQLHIQSVLAHLGQKTEASHVYIFENHSTPDGTPVTSQRYEWAAPGISAEIDNPVFQNVPLQVERFERWSDTLNRGEPFYGSLKTFSDSETEFLVPRGIKSILDVPIFVGNVWWGIIGFDDYVVEREWSVAEVEALKAAASIISAAIQRQRADAALRESEGRYRQAISAADAVPYYIDYQTERYTFMGEAIQKITGYSVEEMTPVLLGQLVQESYMRGANAHLARIEAIRRVRAGESLDWKNDVCIVTRSGQRRWVTDTSVQVLDKHGKPVGTIGILQDITDRKQAEDEIIKLNAELEQRVLERTAQLQESERRFRILFESSPDAIMLINPHSPEVSWAIMECNEVACRMNGYHREELIGQSIDLLNLGPGGPSERAAYMERLHQSGHMTIETHHRRKDGTTFPIEVVTSLIVLAGQEVVLGIDRDITERKRAEQELKQAVLAMEAANKELEAFSYSVSHDLRAPLRSIDGFSQALLEDYGDKIDAPGRKHLQTVRQASQRMGHLIDDLLNLSRMTRAEMRRTRVDLSALTYDLALAFQQRDPQRQVEFAIAPDLVVKGDTNLLRIALENLLDNAWKFTSKQPQARIEVGAKQQADGETAYFVSDNGAGFEMAYADKLFGAFQRLHHLTEFEGTGIGLATVQRILLRHGGRIWAEGIVNQGATFYFVLPV